MQHTVEQTLNKLFFKKNWVFLLGLFFLIVLLFKNPFSGKNYISNLEPFPDTISYLSPLKSIKEGRGINIDYEGKTIPTRVPPLYTLVLLPVNLIIPDIRSFYLTNVLLTLLSAGIFYLVINKLFKNIWIKSLLYLSFITDYVVYWYPSTAMSENLLLPLYLISILLLLLPITTFNIIVSAVLVIALYATKYVAWELSLFFLLIMLVKLRKIKQITLFLGVTFIVFMLFSFLQYSSQGINSFSQIKDNLGSSVLSSVSDTNANFSNLYFKDNFDRYLAGIMGGPVTGAGVDFILQPIAIGFSSIFLIFANLFIKKNRLLSTYFFLSILGTLLYISRFHIVDSRYLFWSIPAFLIIFGISLERLEVFLNRHNRKFYSISLIGIVFIAVFLNVYKPVTAQLKSNFMGGERAYDYEAILTMNEFVSSANFKQKPIIITILAPYLIDFYSSGNYELLPLSHMQYFGYAIEDTWNVKDKAQLTDIYEDELNQGKEVFVSNFKAVESFYYKKDMEQIEQRFNLTLVKTGCDGYCNIYKITNKNN